MSEQVESIETWLVAYIAKELALAPAAIDRTAPFADLGLGSRQSVLLAGDLEDWLGISMPATVAWDYPTIADLSAFLAARPDHATAGDGSAD